jgi:hypothetical protein
MPVYPGALTAPVEEGPDALGAVLEPRVAWVGGTDMLVEPQLAAGPDDPMQFGQRLPLVGHRAQQMRSNPMCS